MSKQRTLWITQTGIFLAILIVAQVFTRPLGQFVTGSINNMLFILAVMLIGLSSAIVLCIASQICVVLLGTVPLLQSFPQLMPVIIAGNIVLVLLWHVVALRNKETSMARKIIALVVSAFAKFLVLFVGIVLLVVPLILHIPEPQASTISALFSWPQLVTASIGGVLALLIYTPLSKALKKKA